MNNKTNDVDFHVYDNTKAEELKQNTKKALAENITQAGIRDAEEGLPRVVGDNLNHYVDPELNGLQQLVDDLRDLHRAEETVHSTITKHKRDVQSERGNRDEIRSKLAQKLSELKTTENSVPTKPAMVIGTTVVALGVIEGLLALRAIRTVVTNFSIAFLVCLVFGLAFGILSHKFHQWFNSGKTKIGRFVRRTALIIGFSTAFYGLGLLRSYQLNAQSTSVDEIINGGILTYADTQDALIFCLISWLFFLPAVIISKYSPTKDQWFNIFRRRSLKKEVQAIQKELDASLSEIKRLNTEIETLKIWDESRLTTARRDEQSAIRMINYLKSLYIQANLRRRLDKKRPDCFDKDFRFYLTLYHQDTTSQTNSNK